LKKCAATIEAMAAANFSRDVLEETGDLIDFETVIETPVYEEDLKSRLLDVVKFRKECLKKYRCIWLKIGSKETCGKRCEEFLCDTHSKCIKRGGKVPPPFLSCGVGVRGQNQLCTGCEKNMGLNINEIKQAHNHHITMGRGRKGIVVQGNKNKKECGTLPKQERTFFHFSSKTPANKTIVDIPDDVLNELRQLNPRNIVNIIVDP